MFIMTGNNRLVGARTHWVRSIVQTGTAGTWCMDCGKGVTELHIRDHFKCLWPVCLPCCCTISASCCCTISASTLLLLSTRVFNRFQQLASCLQAKYEIKMIVCLQYLMAPEIGYKIIANRFNFDVVLIPISEGPDNFTWTTKRRASTLRLSNTWVYTTLGNCLCGPYSKLHKHVEALPINSLQWSHSLHLFLEVWASKYCILSMLCHGELHTCVLLLTSWEC